MTVYRYKYDGVDITRVSQLVPGSLILGETGSDIYTDITAPSSSKEDLDEVMAGFGFAFNSQDPTISPSEQASRSVLSSSSWQLQVISKDLSTPPVSPGLNDRYIVAPPATGDWAGHDGYIADWDGYAWQFTLATAGFATWVDDQNTYYSFTTDWVKLQDTIDAANRELSNLTTTSINASLIPAVNDGYDIGSLSLSWGQAYLSGIHTAGFQLTTSPVDGYFLRSDGYGNATWARADGDVTSLPPLNVNKSLALVGSSSEAARADHKHDIDTGVAITIGTSNFEGTSTALARSDHRHDHGQQTDGYLHALATESVAGFMSPSDKAKLDAVDSANIANRNLSNLLTTAVNTSLNPAVSDGYDLGTPSLHWKDGYVDAMYSATIQLTTGAHDGYVLTSDAAGNAHWALPVTDASILLFGNSSVSGTTSTRFLTPGFAPSMAPTTVVQFRIPFTGTISKLRVYQNSTAGNGNAIVYTLRVNGSTTALTASLASTAADGSDLSHSVSVSAGDLLDIEITKASSIGTSPTDIMASVEVVVS